MITVGCNGLWQLILWEVVISEESLGRRGAMTQLNPLLNKNRLRVDDSIMSVQ